MRAKLDPAAVIFFMAVVAVGIAGSQIEHPSTAAAARGGTEVRIVTPFTSTGTLQPALHPHTYQGTCEPAANDPSDPARTNVYSCRYPRGNDCQLKSCVAEWCWRDPRSAVASMVCLFNPEFDTPGDSIRVLVTNHPKASRGVRNPLNSEPWLIKFADKEQCIAGYPRKNHSPSGPPIIAYTCFGGLGPDGQAVPDPVVRTNRTKSVWTLKMALTFDAFVKGDYSLNKPIAAAWFAGN